MSSFKPLRAWWKSAIVYQIYPSSFADSNGDGIGDLKGITSKLDHLKELGVDVIWLSPIYTSPNADMGYDISNYRDIDPRYGTLADWDILLQETHSRGMKLVMDLVVNHTSDEHPWFRESRSSKENPKRDWYVWRPPKFDAKGERHPPNNWKSLFQGSTWEYDQTTEEYYLHLYHTKQPDLNWENPDVRAAVYDLMNFWIERDCDGFRMDVINLISKFPGLPDAPISNENENYQPAAMYYANGPRVHEFLKELNTKVLADRDLFVVGETPFTHNADDIVPYVLPSNKELQMVFHFEIMDIDSASRAREQSPFVTQRFALSELKKVIGKWQTCRRDEGFWNSLYLENHDQGRSISRFGNDSEIWRDRSAKLLAILQTTLSGTLFVYQGEELGMRNFPETWGIDEYKDVASQNYYYKVLAERKKSGGEVDMNDIMKGLAKKARDHGRTPVQWDDSLNAGFSTGTPWMRVNDDYVACNAAFQSKSPTSVYQFWKEAIRVRKGHEVLTYGDYVDLAPEHEFIYAYKKTLDASTSLVVLNFSDEEASFSVPIDFELPEAKVVLSNYPEQDRIGDHSNNITLSGWEGRVYLA